MEAEQMEIGGRGEVRGKYEEIRRIMEVKWRLKGCLWKSG